MGEQSRDGEAEEPSSYNPFLCPPVEYDATARIRMAEEVAASRKLIISPALREIMTSPENFFHQGQQSVKMAEDAHQRRYKSFNQKWDALTQQRRAEGLPPSSRIPMIEINPTRVTLSLQFESQYFPLMIKERGNDEDISSIMKQTNTLIQIPDIITDGAPLYPFVQQVAITGFYSDVDRARKLMRDNNHVCIIMSLSELTVDLTDFHKFLSEYSMKNVTIESFNTPPDKIKGTFHLRFCVRVKNVEDLIKATNDISGFAFGKKTQPEDAFSLHFGLSTYHIEHVLGKPSTTLLMPEIEKRTSTRITYPSFNSRDDIKESTVVVKVVGKVACILEARKLIMDLLPAAICFNMRNTDLRSPVENGEKREVTVKLTNWNTSITMSQSMYEPPDLQPGEVTMHCASIRSKEFNIKNIYASYHQLLSDKYEVVAPEPDDYDKSPWHRLLPEKFYDFVVPCRGEPSQAKMSSSGSSENMHRNRSLSVTSTHSRRSNSKDQRSSDSSGIYPRQTRLPSSSESVATPTLLNIPQYAYPSLFYLQNPHMATMMKGVAGFPATYPQPIYFQPGYYTHPLATACIHPEYWNNLPPEAFYSPAVLPPGIQVNDESGGRPESVNSARFHPQQNNTRKPSRGGKTPTIQSTSSLPPRQSRFYEPLREDDGRSSTRSASRRTSISGDEPSIGSYEEIERCSSEPKRFHHSGSFNRPFQQHSQYPQRYPKDGSRYKSGNRGDMHNKRPVPLQKDFRGPYDFPSGPPDYPSDQMQFHMTHHLKLKPSDEDLEHERLFTHDSSQAEEQMYSASEYGKEQQMTDGDFARLLSNVNLNSACEGRRSRVASSSHEKEEQPRFTDSDCTFNGADLSAMQASRSTDGFKKLVLPGVTKTMLEPRSRNDRGYGKISLEHRGKFYNEQHPVDGEKMDPMKLIASVHESSEQLPRIHERQFSDVLNEKEREVKRFGPFRELNMESTLVAEPSFGEESSSMDYAFRSDQSAENLQ